MLEFFQFDFLGNFDKQFRQRISVLFLPFGVGDKRRLFTHLKDHFSQNMPPDRLLIIGTSRIKGDLTTLISDPEFADRLPAITRMSGPPNVVGVCRSDNGEFTGISKAGALDLDKALLDQVRFEGLMRIFRDRQGLLEGNEQVHYIKPSGAHSDRFIRAANVLVRGSEVAFIAFWLLDYLQDNIVHIYTDTAAINLVPYAMIQLKLQTNPEFAPPTIDSYGSYEGRGDFPFQAVKRSLFIISASTSGHLEETFFQENPKRDQEGVRANTTLDSRAKFVTIFYLGKRVSGQEVLVDVTKSPTNPHGYEAIVNFHQAECPYCAKHIPAVQITGDQFLPQDPITTQHLIVKTDEPKWLSSVCKDFVGKGVIKCHMPAEFGRRRDIFFDLGQLICSPDRSSEFMKEIDRLLGQCIPARLRQIVYLNDESSKALAEKIKDVFCDSCHLLSDFPLLIPDDSLTDKLLKGERLEGTTMVVAAVSDSGRRLLQTSQALRELQKIHALTYLIGISRSSTPSLATAFRSSLTYGPVGGASYDLRIVRELHLPTDSPSFPNSWESEDRLLEELIIRLQCGETSCLCSIDAEQLLVRLSNRRHVLLARDGPGLTDELFWSNRVGSEPLKLRGTFAFWPSSLSAEDSPKSQADVYFTMVAVCHSIRQRLRLNQFSHQYQRTVFSPLTFERFNDGVVQAAILRAAQPRELDYRGDSLGSAMMGSILDYLLKNIDNQGGEASVEFLVSLACGRLCLAKPDFDRFLGSLNASPKEDPFVAVLSDYIISKHSNDVSAMI